MEIGMSARSGMMKSYRRRLLAAALVCACHAASAAPTQASGASGAAETVEPGPDFDLPDTQGVRRSLHDYRGKVVLIYFGFLSCPDVCPTTLAKLAQVSRILETDATRIQVLFITLDPERDHAEAMRSYAAAFDTRFVALLPPAAEVSRIASTLGAYFRKVPGKQAGSYTVDHSASIHVYDTDGRLRVKMPEHSTAEAIAGNIRSLLAKGHPTAR